MVDGLVISKDKSIFEELNIDFSSENNSFEYADSAESAKEMLELEIPEYLVIIEKSTVKIKNILNDLYQFEEIKKIPVLCFLPASDWSQREILWKMGVKDIIQLPIYRDELKLQFENSFPIFRVSLLIKKSQACMENLKTIIFLI